MAQLVDPVHFRVMDASGLGLGYRVVIRLDGFVDEQGQAGQIGSLEMMLDDDAITRLAGNQKPHTTLSAPIVLDTKEQSFAAAGVGDGMGTYLIDPRFMLRLNSPHIAPGQYTGLLRISIQSGP